MGRDRQHDVEDRLVVVLVSEQALQARDRPEPRDPALAPGFVLLDEARKEVRLAVLQAHDRLDLARPDDRLDAPARSLDVSADRRDLDVELERHFLVVVDARLDRELDPRVLVGERRHGNDVPADGVRRVEGGRRDRHAVADVDLGLLAFRDADLRLADRLRVRIGPEEVQDQAGDRTERPVSLLADRPQIVEGERLRPAEERQRERLAREVDPQVLQRRAVYFEKLDVDDQLGLGFVVVVDDLLGHGDDVGVVLDGDRVELGVLRDLPDIEKRAQEGVDLLRVSAREEERPNDLVLVFGPLLSVVVRDQEGVLVDDLVEVLELEHQDVHGALERQSRQVHRLLLVEVHLVVVEEVDPDGLRDRFVDLLDGLLLELQDDRLVRRRGQARGRERALLGRLFGLFDLARGRLELRELVLRLLQLGLRVGVGAIEEDRLGELRDRELELIGREVALAALEVDGRSPELRPHQRGLVAVVARVEAEGLRVPEHGRVPVLPLRALLSCAEGPLSGAPGQGRDAEENEDRSWRWSFPVHAGPL